MSFIDHLEELRGHIIRSLLVIIVMAVLVFLKIDWVFDNIILGPIRKDFVTYTGLCNFGHFLHMEAAELVTAALTRWLDKPGNAAAER